MKLRKKGPYVFVQNTKPTFCDDSGLLKRSRVSFKYLQFSWNHQLSDKKKHFFHEKSVFFLDKIPEIVYGPFFWASYVLQHASIFIVGQNRYKK